MSVIHLKEGRKIERVTSLKTDGTYIDYEQGSIKGSLHKDKINRIISNEGELIMDFKNKPMKKVIRLDEPKEEKPIELTHYQSSDGWQKAGDYINRIIKESEKIVYIGWCNKDKDMFAVYAKDGYINIAKGELNDGVY